MNLLGRLGTTLLLLVSTATCVLAQQHGAATLESSPFFEIPQYHLPPPRSTIAPVHPDSVTSSLEPIQMPENKPDESIVDRISKLEKQLKELKDKSEEKNDKQSKKKTPDRPTMNFTGRIHLDSWTFPDNSPGIGFFEHPVSGIDPENRIFFRRIRLEIAGDILEFMNYRAQVDFNDPSTPEMKDVFIGFKKVPLFQTVLIGNQKRPLGLDHLTSSRFTVFIERPLVVEAFNEDARRIGICSYTLSPDEAHLLRMGGFMLENVATTGEVVGDAGQWSLNARLSNVYGYDSTPDNRNYFHWAVAGMLANPDGDVDPRDANANEGRFRTRSELRSDLRWLNTDRIAGAEWYEIFALESILNIGPFQVVAEYQNNWLQRDSVTPGTGPDLHFHGAYVYVAYFLTGEHMPYDRNSGAFGRVRPFRPLTFRDVCAGRPKGWGALQVAFRYSYLDLTDADIRGGVEHNYTLGLVWYFNAHSSLQLNAIYGDIRDHRPEGGFTSGHFTALGTRFRVDF